MSRRAISKLERHGPDGFTVRTLRRLCTPLEIDVNVSGRWRGGELDRLLDAAHAALQSAFMRLLEGLGWAVRAEVTFSRYGERGSIDLLAWHEDTGTLLVVEIKTVIADVQGLLRPLDAKVRLAPAISADLGWHPRSVVPCLVVADQSTARRRVAHHAALFGRFALRGWAARRWLRRRETVPTGVLLFVSPDGSRATAGRQRIRSNGSAHPST